jgi:hypothetical protein
MVAGLLGGVVTYHLLRRTGSLQIARSLLIATSSVVTKASAKPAIPISTSWTKMVAGSEAKAEWPRIFGPSFSPIERD